MDERLVPAEGQSQDPEGEVFIPFTVDSALLKELGERLVGKPHIALAELVKNSYDADAETVKIVFEADAIEVIDDGNGMSRREFIDFWMRVGTTHKQRSTVTDRFHRRVSGSKGVGRLSVQFLGHSLKLWSYSKHDATRAVSASIDWREAQSTGDLIRSGVNLASVNPEGLLPKGFLQGTRLRIEGLNQIWGSEELKALARELWFLRPPTALRGTDLDDANFDIQLSGAAEDERQAFVGQLEAAFSNWTAEIKGKLSDGRQGKNADITVQFKDGSLHSQSYPIANNSLDKVDFTIRIYKLSGKQPGGISVTEARDYFRRYGGVHIYDEGFHLPFYGGEGEDWLRLEYDHSHRLMVSKLVPEHLKGLGDLRDLPTNGRVFGITRISTSHERIAAPEISKLRGSYLNVQVTRDRLIDNGPMNALREVVRWSLDYYAYLASAKKYRESDPEKGKRPAPLSSEPIVDELRQRIDEFRKELPKPRVVELERIASGVDALVELENRRDARFKRERILLGALATAGMGAIALEHELGKEITSLRSAIEKLQKWDQVADVDALTQILLALVDRITDARKLFSPLMEPDNRDLQASMRVKPIVESIVGNLRPLLRSTEIDTTGVDSEMRFPSATKAAWMAILQNVLINSANALIDSPSKQISITTSSSATVAKLCVEDSGIGLDLEDSDSLFEPFERRMEISPERIQLGLGGVGLGLTIVRMVAESVGCRVQFVMPSPGMSTAFEISWEAKNEESSRRSNRRR